jgi:hypothetical protein
MSAASVGLAVVRGTDKETSRRSAPRVEHNSTSFCECLLVEEKGDKETREGGGTKAIMAAQREGFAVGHRFSERSPCVASVNRKHGEHLPAVREPIPLAAAGRPRRPRLLCES